MGGGPVHGYLTGLPDCGSERPAPRHCGRTVRGMVAIALLVVACLFPASSQAQDTQTFLDNLVTGTGAQHVSGFGFLSFTDQARTFAQGFMTGGHSTGYVLDSVDLVFNIVPDAVSVQIRADNGSDAPSDTVLYQLTSPGSITQNAATNFTAPRGAVLTTSTKYHVVMFRTGSTSNSGSIRLRLGDDPRLEETAAAGWEFDGQMYWKSSPSAAWADQGSDNHIGLRIKGLEMPATAGTPRVTGIAQVGEVLTADTRTVTDEHGLTGASFTHQWWRIDADGTNPVRITGETNATYTLVVNDVGKKIRARVGYMDDDGNFETVTSDPYPATGTVEARPNSSAGGTPVITGTARVGETLTATPGDIADTNGFDEANFTYTWRRVDADGTSNPEDITGASGMGVTFKTYTLADADFDKKISVSVSFTDNDGYPEGPFTSARVPGRGSVDAAYTAGVPRISGPRRPKVDETLTADTSSVTDPDGVMGVTYTYQWLREDADGTNQAPIAGATNASYMLVKADEGKRVRVRVNFTDEGSNAETRTSDEHPARVTVERRRVWDSTGNAEITGIARVGRTLTVMPGAIADRNGFDEANFRYQWLRHEFASSIDTTISGATEKTYRLTMDDEGFHVYVFVRFNDNDGYQEIRESLLFPSSTSDTIAAQAANAPATGELEIDDGAAAQVGVQLSAVRAITDANGLDDAEYAYQWERTADTAPVNPTVTDVGADSEDYTPDANDQGMYLRVAVTFLDDDGHEETITSAWTRAVAATAPILTGTTFISNVEKTVQALVDDTNGQAFTTGSDAAGYTISGIDLHVGVVGTVTASDPWRVAIYENLSGPPSGSALYTLTAPASITANAVNSFTAPANTFLNANTKYHVVIDPPSAGMPTYGRIGISDGLDGTAATGWDFPEGLRLGPSGDRDWSAASTSRRLMVRVRGTVGGMAISRVTVDGAPRVGVELTANTDRIIDPHPTNPEYSYRWERADDATGTTGLTNVGNASATYTPERADLGKFIRVTVSYTDDGNNAGTSVTSDWTSAIERRPDLQSSGMLEIEGIARVGRLLTATVGNYMDPNGFDEATFRYQWVRNVLAGGNEIDIVGAESNTYRLTVDDLGSRVYVTVRFTDNDGYPELAISPGFPLNLSETIAAQAANTDAGGSVTIDDGTMAQVGVQLSAVRAITDANGMDDAEYAYQWERTTDTAPANPTVTEVGTDENYTPVKADQGMFLRVSVTFLDDDGHEETVTSDWTRAVERRANSPLAEPSGGGLAIDGIARVGRVLTSRVLNISDANGFDVNNFSYVWFRHDIATSNDTPINGATSDTYRLTMADQGFHVYLYARVVDNDGYPEETFSSLFPSGAGETIAAQAANTDATGTVTINDGAMAQVGTRLSAVRGMFTDANGLIAAEYTYQWEQSSDVTTDPTNPADLTEVGTGSENYTPDANDQGMFLRVSVTFLDDDGHEETIASAWTRAVTAAAPILTGTTFISNVEKTVLFLVENVKGQAFTTGSESAGYTIGNVDIHVGAVGTVTASDPWRVTIREDASGIPSNSVLYTLTAPASVTANAINTFTAPANAFLSGSTKYHIVIDPPDAGTPTYGRTGVSDGLDATVAAGWNFPEGRRNGPNRVAGLGWSGASGTRRLMVRIRGTVGGMAVSRVTIDGTPRVDVELTANTDRIIDSDGLTTATYSYQWERADDAAGTTGLINVGTAATYTPVKDDQGKFLRVTVSYTDDGDNDETIASTWTSEVERRVDLFNSGNLEIEGIARVGRTLTAVVGSFNDPNGFDEANFSYSWRQIDPATFAVTPIPGATAKTYRLTIDDLGVNVAVRANFNDDDGYPEVAESDIFPAEGTVAAQAANTPAAGDVTIDDGAAAEVGVQLSAVTTGTTGISDANGLTTSEYSYQWQSAEGIADPASPTGSANIGTDSADYTPAAGDVGKYLRVVVTFTDDDGHEETKTSEWTMAVLAAGASPSTPATGNLTIDGGDTARVSVGLMANTSDIDDPVNGLTRTPTTFTYQWQRADDSAGAGSTNVGTGVIYTPVAEDETKYLRVVVTFMDDQGNDEAKTSEWIGPIGAAPATPDTPATGDVTVVNDPPPADGVTVVKVGVGLTVDTDSIDDPVNGLTPPTTFTYQWRRADDAAGTRAADITGAASETYTPVKDDQDKSLRVVVTFRDDDGYPETKASAWTSAVARRDDTAATGDVTIDGGTAPQEGVQLLADISGIDDLVNGLNTPNWRYQWERADDTAGTGLTDVGADSANYTPQAVDAGKFLRVVVTYTDDDGYEGTSTSGWTGVVLEALEYTVTATKAEAFELAFGADAATATTANQLAFTIALNRPPEQTAEVTYRFSDQSSANEILDFIVTPASKTFSFGPNAPLTQTITVTAIGDPVAEGDGESVIVELVGVEGASARGTITEPSTQVAISTSAPTYTHEDRTVSFVVSVDTAPAFDLDVDWRVVGGRISAGSGLGRSAVARVTQSCTAIPCEGTATILAGNTEVTVDAEFEEQIASGTKIEVQIKPPPSYAVESVMTVDTGSQAVRVGNETYVVAAAITIVLEAPAALVHAVAGVGRTVATGIVEGIWRRAAARRASGHESQATLGGKTLDTNALTSGDAGRTVREVASLLGLEAAAPDASIDGLDSGHGGGIDDYRAWAGIPDHSRLASQSSFALSVGGWMGTTGPITIWGEMSVSGSVSKPSDTTSIDSESSDILLGFDLPVGDGPLFGIAVSRSSGESEYRDSSANGEDGETETSLMTFAPYVHWTNASGISMWGSLGTGSGTLEMANNGSATEETDINMAMVAAGAKSPSTRIGRGEFAVRGDFFRIALDAAQTAGFGELSAEASRIRLAVEGTAVWEKDSGAVTSNRMELGARMDSGDSEEGAGADVAVEIRYATLDGLEIKGRLSSLLLHQQDGFREWGAGLGFAYAPGVAGRGVSMSFEPTWNVPRSGVAESMWGLRDLDSYASSTADAEMTARLGYGASTMRDRVLVTLYGETESGDDSRRLRLGAEMRGLAGSLERLSLDVYGQRKEGQLPRPSDSIMLEGSLGF